MTRKFLTLLAAGSFAALASITLAPQAQAATTLCPDTAATTDREFSLTTDPGSTCLASGSGNIDNNAAFNTQISGLGISLLDKTDDGSDAIGSVVLNVTGILNTSGSFSIVVPVGYTLTNAVLGFKSGEGQIDPDWAAFSLPDGVLSGSWAIDNSAAKGDQSLSHANLYGNVVPTVVPLPAGGLLLISALGGLVMLRRRKQA